MAENKEEKYFALNGLRALACIGIVAMHVYYNTNAKPASSWFINNILVLTGDFVYMFMMVSAFALSCGYFKRFEQNSISIKCFYEKRYARILPFFVMLIIIDILKRFVMEHFSMTSEMIGGLWESFANVTLMFGLIPGNDISVIGVGWFLGVIFLFYMLYPFFTFLLHSKNSAWISLAISLGLYVSCKLYFVPEKGAFFENTSMICCAPYFLVGGLTYLYRLNIVTMMEKKVSRIVLWFVSVAFTAFFFVFSSYRFEFANLIMYSLWLFYAVSEVSFNRKTTFLNNNVMTFLSGISMEVYLCHMIIFRLVVNMHVERFVSNTDVNYWITFVLTLAGAVAFSWCWKKYCEPRVLTLLKGSEEIVVNTSLNE